MHFCFAAPRKRQQIQHRRAQGRWQENGKPGIRKDYSDKYYAACVVDPDGYRLEAHCETDH